jgi:plasmid replication initiation protein
MADQLLERTSVTTPETLGVTPRYVLQHNAISRSAHNLSATAKKLTAMAMALLPSNLSSLTVAFTFIEFCKAIGYTKSGESFKLFLAALKECVNSSISLEITTEKTGKKKWEHYTWFISSDLDEETGVATMTFSPQLATVIVELKRVYSKIILRDIGELQSKYAIRLFELAISYSSLKGQHGNRDLAWYFERSVQELRFMMGIPEDTYKETRLFRQKVIEEPVKEINRSGIGLAIKTEGVKQGRRLAAIRFDCQQMAHILPQKGNRRKKSDTTEQLEFPDISRKTASLRKEKELQHLNELYPEEFTALYAQELEKPSFLPPTSNFRKQAAAGAAQARLREKYGIIK